MEYKIAVIPGDGIGVDVIREAVRSLDKIGEVYGHQFHKVERLVGGCCIDAYSVPIQPETLELCRECDAILFGAAGGPKWDHLPRAQRPESGLAALRRGFNLFCNLRPAKLYPDLRENSPLKNEVLDRGLDLLLVRDLIGGIYFGEKGMHELEIPVYKDYFLLFDECEKAIQDVGYRGDIYLPVEDFFKFENKAMVSATPIVPSDPRFEENGFKILKLVPTYDSRIELTLCTTNNTVAVMRKLLKRLENETVCVFLNSTETILSLIYALRLQGRSRVFCSEKSVRKLKQMNFTDASETLDELAPVNFLTSRFYAAVDIKLDYKPHVILLTDVMRAPFSAVDPQTEVVQAIGRFRNGVARAYHIANTSDNLQCLTREALERRLTGEENIYNQIRQIQPDGEDEAQARFQALNGMAYKRFVTRDGNRNHFMWDNAWTDEQIKAYYRYPSTLTAAYKSAPFRLTVCTAHYPITDADRLRREKAKMNTRELWREVVGQLAKLQTAHSDMEPAFLQEELGNEFAAIVQAFTILGAKRMEELGYSRSKIEAAMTRTEENVLLTAPKMQEAVYAQYKTGDLVACSEINNFLHRLIVNNGIPFEGRRVDRKVVKLFFEIEDDTKRLGGQKAFLLGKKMFEF